MDNRSGPLVSDARFDIINQNVPSEQIHDIQIDDSDDEEFIPEAVETEPIEIESVIITTKNTSRVHESNG